MFVAPITPDGKGLMWFVACQILAAVGNGFGTCVGYAMMADAIVRLIPGAIGDETSALSDSFQDNLLAPPVYTRPAEYKGWRVPDILLSGHQAKVEEWLHQQSVERTMRLRPDLLEDEP